MAKNTGKKRKRKNVRLHRTVRKTIAAIFMIMAVVVAAIPVEQLGTMQAKTTARDNNITKIFDTVVEGIDNNDKMNQALKSVVRDIMDYPGSNTTGTTVQMRIMVLPQYMIRNSGLKTEEHLERLFSVMKVLIRLLKLI